MLDRFPHITISVREPHREFLNSFADLAKASGKYSVEKEYDVADMDKIEIKPKQDAIQDGLFGQLVHMKHYKKRIKAAPMWGSDPINYKAYVEATEYLFKDLLRQYNRKHGQRYRLHIPSRQACEPKLTPKANEAFRSFLTGVNKKCLNHFDWKHFYRFIWVCHKTRVKLPESDITRLLYNAGFLEDYAQDIASVYLHCRKFATSI